MGAKYPKNPDNPETHSHIWHKGVVIGPGLTSAIRDAPCAGDLRVTSRICTTTSLAQGMAHEIREQLGMALRVPTRVMLACYAGASLKPVNLIKPTLYNHKP